MRVGHVHSIESMGLVDGPGIRTVIFLQGCALRCRFCHNPDTWELSGGTEYTPEELVAKIKQFKPYFKEDGGVTFSGGEPLLNDKFIIELSKKLKKENINIAIDTAGVGNGAYEEILKYIDLVILDIKHTDPKSYKELTGQEITHVENFIQELNKQNKKVWIRQVIVPGIMDNDKYIDLLANTLLKIKNIERIDFLPYHKLGESKYEKLKREIPFKNIEPMDKDKCDNLYSKFLEKYHEKGGIFVD